MVIGRPISQKRPATMVSIARTKRPNHFNTSHMVGRLYPERGAEPLR